jgi:hypothetical protein
VALAIVLVICLIVLYVCVKFVRVFFGKLKTWFGGEAVESTPIT